jgi:drug/metabolite transporter (DMT)-like permease
LWLLAGGFICEFVGARLQLYAYVTIGILIAAPLIQGASMSGNALLGRYWLGDRLSIWKKVAIAILLPAVVVTLVGKELTVNSAQNVTTDSTTNITTNVESNTTTNITANVTSDVDGNNNSFYSYLLAGIGSVVAGFAYALHMVIVRYAGHKYWDDNRYSAWQSMRFRHWIGHDKPSRNKSRNRGDSGFYAPFPVTLIMAIILFVGILAFGGCLLEREGIAGLWDEPTDCWYLVVATGLCNVIGFFFQVQGLRMTAAAQVSIVATGQFVFLALFGMFVFNEQSNLVIWLGVALVVIGVLISAKQEKMDS